MKYTIRNLNINDYERIEDWYKSNDLLRPSLGLIPFESHFILEVEGKPIISLGLFLTNSELAYVENFISDPYIDDSLRDISSKILAKYVIEFAQKLGYKRLYCSTLHKKLADRYKELGMQSSAQVYALTMQL